MYTSEDELTGSFTFNAEGSTDPSNPYYIGRLSYPGGISGVTIGAGYDMGGRTQDTVKNDLIMAGLDTTTAEKLSKGAGLSPSDAEKFVRDNKDILVNVSVLQALFAKTYPGYVAAARSNFKYHAHSFRESMKSYGDKYKDAIFFDWEYLYPAIRVIAIDFTYQGFGKQKAGYGRPLHFCMANDFDWLIEYITHSPGLSQYEAGRHRADYLRKNRTFQMNAFSDCPG